MTEDRDGAIERGEFFRKRRIELDLRLSEIAPEAEKSRHSLDNIEKGITNDPGILSVNGLARAYQMSVEEILRLYGVQLSNTNPDE